MSKAAIDMKYQLFLPTKVVRSPRKLLQAVIDSAGEGNFYIEMRHNTYRISSNEEVDVKEIFVRCR
jgi:hypothetical protein